MSNIIELLKWARKGFSLPAPSFVKRSCLRRHGFRNSTWVETGTYLGDTTKFLAGLGARVVTIEPEPSLFQRARDRFSRASNVEVMFGLSEQIFPTLLPTLEGPVNFWLDGHFSEGITHRGPKETPIEDELNYISKYMNIFDGVCVLVDDLRLFRGTASEQEGSAYPEVNSLVSWATKNGLSWTIEYDIFIAKSKK
jgi:hypothetical protein